MRYKAYPGEGYYVYGRDNTIQKLNDMLDFFEEFLVTEIVGMQSRLYTMTSLVVTTARQCVPGGCDREEVGAKSV